MTRIPTDGDCAILTPVKPGSVAHQLGHYRATSAAQLADLWAKTGNVQAGPRCQGASALQNGQRYAVHSAAWADSLGCVACPDCYPVVKP